MQRRHHPSTPYERHGQVNVGPRSLIKTPSGYLPLNDIEKGQTIEVHYFSIPDCVILVSKRRGWGTTGNHESQPMSPSSTSSFIKNIPGKLFMRYKVNIYLKR